MGECIFTEEEKKLALELAYKLEKKEYDSAYAMLSSNFQATLSATEFRRLYEQMISEDWGEIDPIELMDSDEYPFLYVVLGGDVYSEAIIIDRFVVENGNSKIDSLEFGRP